MGLYTEQSFFFKSIAIVNAFTMKTTHIDGDQCIHHLEWILIWKRSDSTAFHQFKP